MTIRQEALDKLEVAFADDNSSYAMGYRDALESFVLALMCTMADGLLLDGLQCAIDAYSNNVDDDGDPDEYEYEDDGQPDEMQEWHDFDPDC